MMGHHLEEMFGAKYYAFGFSFKKVLSSPALSNAFRVRKTASEPSKPALSQVHSCRAPEGYLEWYMSKPMTATT